MPASMRSIVIDPILRHKSSGRLGQTEKGGKGMMVTIWSHSCCIDCWIVRQPGRIPCRVKNGEAEVCCFCGNSTTDGVFVRENPTSPALQNCGGKHEESE